MGKIVRGMAASQAVRFFVTDTTELVEEARQIHQLSPVAAAALGRTLTGASLMGSMLKNDADKLTFQVKGDGPLGVLLAVSDATGYVKGYVAHPNVELPPTESGKLDVGTGVGRNGELIVIKDYGLKEPFIGRTKLVSGEIAEDLAAYFMYSEQQPSIVSLGVFVGADGRVERAGGLVIQPMPFADDAVIDQLEDLAAHMPAMTDLLAGSESMEALIAIAMAGLDTEVTAVTENGYRCDCNRDKFERGIMVLGADEISQMIEEDGKADVHCHFCNKNYHFSREDLVKILELAEA
ncbi:Hsp33 family molecular chaperone HslO [Acidaminobacter hydrogenoformans]|uniref:33 kDa chaperonin n=1 Tax=Acidaminobacter hydrogenoformans DSM 2784 TaxID=1120920 RepID=A0A1G5RWA1_9FIRM|nr:Hsp33 family molecular chaperone HslO [Acidaminobacter hydrogenoformans]SCZ77589.1 molecular chaperone Hsp33 [Acidaminobacter hydrogenoformans DSM 2784]